jgi:GLPGLI family protein
MKKLISTLVVAVLAVNGFSQVKTGTITYERTQNMHRIIQNEQMKSMVPEFRNSKHLLIFNDSESVYKLVPEMENEESGGGMVFRMGGSDGGVIYKNMASGKSIEERELGAKTFLITDSIKGQKWKISAETKQILGYNCRKATTTIETRRSGARVFTSSSTSGTTDTTAKPTTVLQEVVAWFAYDISCPIGPDNYSGLPGVILQLDVDKGLITLNAVELKTTANTKELKEPKKGKKVTREEFTKMMMDAFGGQGGGQRMMRFGN